MDGLPMHPKLRYTNDDKENCLIVWIDFPLLMELDHIDSESFFIFFEIIIS